MSEDRVQIIGMLNQNNLNYEEIIPKMWWRDTCEDHKHVADDGTIIQKRKKKTELGNRARFWHGVKVEVMSLILDMVNLKLKYQVCI